MGSGTRTNAGTSPFFSLLPFLSVIEDWRLGSPITSTVCVGVPKFMSDSLWLAGRVAYRRMACGGGPRTRLMVEELRREAFWRYATLIPEIRKSVIGINFCGQLDQRKWTSTKVRRLILYCTQMNLMSSLYLAGRSTSGREGNVHAARVVESQHAADLVGYPWPVFERS